MAEAGILVGVPKFQKCALLTRKRRPREFVKTPTYFDDTEDNESTSGKMPPAEESDS